MITWINKGKPDCDGEVRTTEETVDGKQVLRTTCNSCRLDWYTEKK